MKKTLIAATALALWGLASAGPARALDNVVIVTGWLVFLRHLACSLLHFSRWNSKRRSIFCDCFFF